MWKIIRPFRLKGRKLKKIAITTFFFCLLAAWFSPDKILSESGSRLFPVQIWIQELGEEGISNVVRKLQKCCLQLLIKRKQLLI